MPKQRHNTKKMYRQFQRLVAQHGPQGVPCKNRRVVAVTHLAFTRNLPRSTLEANPAFLRAKLYWRVTMHELLSDGTRCAAPIPISEAQALAALPPRKAIPTRPLLHDKPLVGDPLPLTTTRTS